MNKIENLNIEKNNNIAIIISGLLGAGKTTILNNFLENNNILSTKIIVNDIGEINVDSRNIKSDNISALQEGCICCGDITSFENAIKNMAEESIKENKDNKNIIIEPTGIAEASSIKSVLKKNGYKTNILTIVSVQDYLKKREEIKKIGNNQIKEADIILLTWNKVNEKYNEEKRKFDEEETIKHILSTNPNVKIFDSNGQEIIIKSEIKNSQEEIKNSIENILYFKKEIKNLYQKLWQELNEINISDKTKLSIFSINGNINGILGKGNLFRKNISIKHSHPIETFSNNVNFKIEDLEKLVEVLGDKIERAKGVVSNQKFDIVDGKLNIGEKSEEKPYFNIITSKNIFQLFQEILNEENEEIIYDLMKKIVIGDEKNGNLSENQENLNNLKEINRKFDKLDNIRWYSYKLKLDEIEKKLKKEKNSEKIIKLKEERKRLLEEKQNYDLEQKNLTESIYFDNPIIWLQYKIFTLKGTPNKIFKVGDLVNSLSKKSAQICKRRFHYINSFYKKLFNLDLQERKNRNISIEKIFGNLEILSNDNNFINGWLAYEYFKEKGLKSSWENYNISEEELIKTEENEKKFYPKKKK